MSWLVQIVRLPLPAMPLSEMIPVGTEIVPDQYFPDEQSAFACARHLAQRGYRVRIVGDGVTMESEEVLRRLNADHASTITSIGKSRIAGAVLFATAFLVPVQVTASAFSHDDSDVDAHRARISLQFSPAVTAVSGTTASISSTSVTSLSGAPINHSFMLDAVVFDATMEAEYRLVPYPTPLIEYPRPADTLSPYFNPPGHRISAIIFTMKPPEKI